MSFLKVNNIKERRILVFCDCKPYANKALVSPAPRNQRVSAKNSLGLCMHVEYRAPWLSQDTFRG